MKYVTKWIQSIERRGIHRIEYRLVRKYLKNLIQRSEYSAVFVHSEKSDQLTIHIQTHKKYPPRNICMDPKQEKYYLAQTTTKK